MQMSQFMVASLLGALSFSSGALATRSLSQLPTHFPNGKPINIPRPSPSTPTPSAPIGTPSSGTSFSFGSKAKCTVVSIGYNEVSNNEARAEAAANAAAFVCGGEGEAEASAIAQATASAFALAVASVSGDCELSGDSTGNIFGSASAQATATAWLSAYAEALAFSATCEQCEAFTESFAYVTEEVFLSAFAKASAGITVYSDSPIDKVVEMSAFDQDLEEAVVTAYAEALSSAKKVYESNECYAFGNAEGCIVTEDNPGGICASCEAETVSFSAIQEIPAVATAISNAIAFTCGDKALAKAEAEVTAKAVAEAMALAISYIHADCTADDGGFACIDVGTYIVETAETVAKAVAEAWAGGLTCTESCDVEAEAATESVATILVEASTNAYTSFCVSGTSWTVELLSAEIEKGYLEAIASAFAGAIVSVDPNICIAVADAETSVDVPAEPVADAPAPY